MQHRNKNDRGQVGIGTLIVFIAMVLVAAIAAGVLINTAGFLQTKSQATGQQSAAQVSNRIQVVSAYGNVSANDRVDLVNISVMRSAGADNINVTKATINWIGPQKATTLTWGATAGAKKFSTEQIAGDDKVLKAKDTRIKVVLNATAVQGDGDGLVAGDQVSLTITTQYGSKTPVLLSVPESLTNKKAVKLT